MLILSESFHIDNGQSGQTRDPQWEKHCTSIVNTKKAMLQFRTSQAPYKVLWCSQAIFEQDNYNKLEIYMFYAFSFNHVYIYLLLTICLVMLLKKLFRDFPVQ